MGVVMKFRTVFGFRMLLFLGIASFSLINVKSQIKSDSTHVISLEKAKEYIENLKSHPNGVKIDAGYLSRNIFDLILSQSRCVGIRYYYAQMPNGQPTIILVGVDSLGKDLGYGILGEEIKPCPPFCDTSSPLSKP